MQNNPLWLVGVKEQIITSPPANCCFSPGSGGKYCDDRRPLSVCLFVCISVCLHVWPVT